MKCSLRHRKCASGVLETHPKINAMTARFATMTDAWNARKDDANGYYLLCRLPQAKMDVDLLGKILEEHYRNTEFPLSTTDTNERANIRRLIRMYDYLRWYKK